MFIEVVSRFVTSALCRCGEAMLLLAIAARIACGLPIRCRYPLVPDGSMTTKYAINWYVPPLIGVDADSIVAAEVLKAPAAACY